QTSSSKERMTDHINYGQLVSEIRSENIKSITINRDTGITYGEFYHSNTNGKKLFRCQTDKNLIEGLVNKLEQVKKLPNIEFVMVSPIMVTLWTTYVPMLLIVVLIIFIIRKFQSSIGNSSMFNFAKSQAKLFSPSKDEKKTFNDVAGVTEAKEKLKEIVDFLREPGKFQKLGGRIPKGVLLIGAPGTGKTLLARAVAGEANVPFFSVSGSEFIQMYVGVGAARVRDMFLEAEKSAPCILFIDEIDSVGRQRGTGLNGGHSEMEQTLNQILSSMDGFKTNHGVIVMAATNRPDVLDPALLRPGRFDRQVVVDKPDIKGRTEILKIHVKKVPLANDVELEMIARGTPGFSGADLANLVNEAALNAARCNKKEVDMIDFEFAKDEVLVGSERRSIIISPQEKKVTAYHEAGHAILAALMPSADPIHKITIVPRGISMGSTSQLPEEDRHNYSKQYLTSLLAILMGGRCAEEIKFGKDGVTSGASNDIQRARDIAQAMVCEWGMSELGPCKFGNREEKPFLGRQVMEQSRDYSEETARKIDAEIKKLITEAYATAVKTLTARINLLDTVSQRLIDKETIDAKEFKQILNQKES
ncbi:MAG: ATP-dependent zinc metalloprotease FtsH, partial [Candidatus Yanofskybacteria bacterium]|nr:ATP-dependent zinc metalloprotease FtsH [Candidatus Yanofskybacteria bacterium]